MLVGNYFDGATSIKREVGVVYNITKSSTHKACDHYKASNGFNIDSSHSNDYLGEAECNACSKHCHDNHDMSSSCRPPSNCGRQSNSRRSDGYDGKHGSRGTERGKDFRPASQYFHGRHEFSSINNLCWRSTKDHSSSSESLRKPAEDWTRNIYFTLMMNLSIAMQVRNFSGSNIFISNNNFNRDSRIFIHF